MIELYFTDQNAPGGPLELLGAHADEALGLAAGTIAAALVDREQLSSTEVAPGLFLPHVALPGVDGICIGLARTGQWNTGESGAPVHLALVVGVDSPIADRRQIRNVVVSMTSRDGMDDLFAIRSLDGLAWLVDKHKEIPHER